MGLLKKLKDIPGVGTPVEDQVGNGIRKEKNIGPLGQAGHVIVEDLNTRVANVLIEGYDSIINPPKRQPTEKELKEKDEKKRKRKEKNEKVVKAVGNTGGRILNTFLGGLRSSWQRARLSDEKGGEENEIIDVEYRIIDDNIPRLEDGNG